MCVGWVGGGWGRGSLFITALPVLTDFSYFYLVCLLFVLSV